jgi:hypothetical protein
MVEGPPNRPIPEGELKPKSPDAGAGPLGKPPPPGREQSPQGRGSKSPERPRRQPDAQEQEILAKLQKAKEFLGKLPYPLAPEMLEGMIRSAVKEGWRKAFPDPTELQRQIDKMDEEVMEALQDPIQRRKLLEGD